MCGSSAVQRADNSSLLGMILLALKHKIFIKVRWGNKCTIRNLTSGCRDTRFTGTRITKIITMTHIIITIITITYFWPKKDPEGEERVREGEGLRGREGEEMGGEEEGGRVVEFVVALRLWEQSVTLLLDVNRK